MRFTAGGKECDCTYLSATRGENLGLERSGGNAGVDPMTYSEAGTCGNSSLPWTPRKTGRNNSPLLPFIPSEAGGFLNSPARTGVPAQTRAGGRNPRKTRGIKMRDHEAPPVYGTQNRFARTRNGPSRFLRSPITAPISSSVRTTWELTPPTEIPPYLRGGAAKVRVHKKSGTAWKRGSGVLVLPPRRSGPGILSDRDSCSQSGATDGSPGEQFTSFGVTKTRNSL